MGEIRSAREIAMEKVEKLEEATDEERLKWKYVPEGEKLAARYLKEDCNLVAELSNYEEKATKYVVEGAAEILIRDIAKTLFDIADFFPEIIEKGAPKGSVPRRKPDLSKLKKESLFVHEIPFEDGLKNTYNWYKKYS